MKQTFLIIAVLLTLIPFLHPGLFDVHDPTSAFRLFTLIDTIKAGQFPPAWSNLLNFGYGYPLHLFYAPLFGYLGAVFIPLVSSYELSIKLALLVASLLGSFGMYKLMYKVGFYPAILSAIAFTYLPYRAGALYVRGSYSEFLAMSLLPWVIYFWQMPQNTRKNIIASALVTSLFILSHNTLPILLIPILLFLIALYQSKNLVGTFYALALVFGLTSWFIFPVFFERSFVQVENIARLTNYSDHFLKPIQLWFSPWGYGGSGVGISGDQMSFMIGKGQLILGLIGGLFLIKAKKWQELFLFGFIVTFAIYLSLDYSQVIWRLFPILAVMQFPWRSLAVLGVGVSVLAGYSLQFIPKYLRLLSTLVLAILLIYTNFAYFKPQAYRDYNQDILSSKSNLNPLIKDKIPEYLPVWMHDFPRVEPQDGLTHSAVKVTGTINLTTPSTLNVQTAYMPQWQLKVNGKQTKIIPDEAGFISTAEEFKVGSYQIDLSWHRTFVENLGLSLTGFSILVVIGLLII